MLFDGSTATNNQKVRSGITHLFSKNPLWGQWILFNSLFSDGKTTALVNTINGLDDFELIGFLVMMKGGG